ncbi:hypothetical protein EV174_001858, partial [Coemansia sp. RSA 2320]
MSPHTLVSDPAPDHDVPANVCPVMHGSAARTGTTPIYTKTREDESMRQALKLLNPIRDDFRLADYAESFNWAEISAEFQTQLLVHADLPPKADSAPDNWYAVVFRSKRRTDCNNVDLFEADRNAYREAFSSTNGSLLMYWYTELDADDNCLATCVWSNRELARSVNMLPAHREAARLSAGSYVHYIIDRVCITWLPDEARLD